jgi:hypothetical protein
MVLASGRFDVVKLEALAREHGGEVEEYKGKRLITRLADDHERRSMTVAFMSPGVVGLGDTEHVKRAIDRVSSGTNVLANKELMDLVDDIDNNNAWAVGRFDALMSHANLPQGVASQIPAIRWFSASGQVNGGLSGQLRAEARDEQAGQNLRDVANGFLALARLQSGNKPEMQALVNSLQLSGSGKTVSLSFAIPAEVLDALGAAGNALHKHDAAERDPDEENNDEDANEQ